MHAVAEKYRQIRPVSGLRIFVNYILSLGDINFAGRNRGPLQHVLQSPHSRVSGNNVPASLNRFELDAPLCSSAIAALS